MSNRDSRTSSSSQPYDHLLKSLLEGREKEMLHYFLEDAEYQETLDVEIHRTTLRVDRVYKIMYKGQLAILHLEFESGPDENMDVRLLDYHAYLYRKYRIPVFSTVVYPFRTNMVVSPLREVDRETDILIFHFRVFPLWKLNAEQYVKDHALFMYTLLPTMNGANAKLLNTAISEMVEYYKDDNERLSREMRWLGIMLRRADTVALEEKRIIEERLNMYDDLMERDPKMKRLFAEKEAKGKSEGEAKGKIEGEAKGKIEGKIEGLQVGVVEMVGTLFPDLADLAQQRVPQITNMLALRLLLRTIVKASDQTEAKQALDLIIA